MKSKDFILTFIKEKKVLHKRIPGICEKLRGLDSISSESSIANIRNSLHSREISVVHYFQMSPINNDKIRQDFLATGGEDCAIKIHKILVDNGNIRRERVASLNGHMRLYLIIIQTECVVK